MGRWDLRSLPAKTLGISRPYGQRSSLHRPPGKGSQQSTPVPFSSSLFFLSPMANVTTATIHGDLQAVLLPITSAQSGALLQGTPDLSSFPPKLLPEPAYAFFPSACVSPMSISNYIICLVIQMG